MVQKKYTVDLAGQLAECEANYARIMQLLPNMGTEDHRLFTVDLAAERQVQFHIEVRACAPVMNTLMTKCTNVTKKFSLIPFLVNG